MAIKEEALVTNVRLKPLIYPKIVQCFLDADLRGGHNFLSGIAKKYGLILGNLTDNQFVVFINRRQNMMKCFVAGNTITFTKRDRIDLLAIESLPQAFGYTGELSYDKALEISLKKRLKSETKSKHSETLNLSKSQAFQRNSEANA